MLSVLTGANRAYDALEIVTALGGDALHLLVHIGDHAAKAAHPLLRNRVHLSQPDVTAAAARQISGQRGRYLR